MRRLVLLSALIAVVSAKANANHDPVRWSVAVSPASVTAGGLLTVRLTAAIEDGWFIYGMRQPSTGPVALKFFVGPSSAISVAGPVRGSRAKSVFDEGFRKQVTKHSSSASFDIPVRINPRRGVDGVSGRVAIRYQACTATVCLPARTVAVPFSVGRLIAG